MDPELGARRCPICAEPCQGASAICAACEQAFGETRETPGGDKMDLERYAGKMFPWEPSKITPNLVSGRRAALVLCLALVLIVVLLSLLRAPIPSCWEVG
jgi:hypothetical protein